MKLDKRVVAPLVTFVAVGALGVSVALVGGGHNSHRPRILRLADQPTARDAVAFAPTAGGDYVLATTLPTGPPDDAAVWTMRAPSAATVGRLAKALGQGTPERSSDGWTAGNLNVDATGQWWFSDCVVAKDVSASSSSACVVGVGVVVPGSVSSGSGATGFSGSGVASANAGTAVSSPAPPPTRATPVPADQPPVMPLPSPAPTASDATVRATAGPVFDALGLDIADARIADGAATLDRTVGGLRTVGLTTRVGVSADGSITDANGSLADLEQGDRYPLISAKAAYDALPPTPRPMMLCPVGPDGKGCPTPEPLQITGAELGLSVAALRDGKQALVPSWLFTVKGSDWPATAIAVQPSYLAPPDVPVDDPGTVKPVPPVEEPPATPVATRAMFSFDKAERTAHADEVLITYGDSGSCPHQNVTHLTKEGPSEVVIVLEADAMDPAVACTDDYRAMTVLVKLSAPLGDRAVVDAKTGKPVPVS